MRRVQYTPLHLQRMASGLKASIENRGNLDKNLEAAAVGKRAALGGATVPGLTYIMTAKPSFLSRPQKIIRRAYVVTSTANDLDCLHVVDFIPDSSDD